MGQQWATPLYLFIGAYMMLSAATEVDTTQRIESLLASTGLNALLVLAFTNGTMIIGRAYAGPIQAKTSTVGMLWFSAIFSFIGMHLLATASGSFVFVAADTRVCVGELAAERSVCSVHHG